MAKMIDVSEEIKKFEARMDRATIGQYGPMAGTGTQRAYLSFSSDPHIRRIVIAPAEYGEASLEERNDAALALAGTIAARLADREYELKELGRVREARNRAQLRANRAERKLALVTGARNPQPHMQDMLLRMASDGAVWLHGWADKAKGSGAFGYRWSDARYFWAAHPEYRPVEWGEDDGGPWMRLKVIPFELQCD